MKKIPLLTIILGVGHGLADCMSGLLIGNLSRVHSLEETGIALLIYNMLAFGGQLPIGMVMDKVGKNKAFALLGLGLISFSWYLLFGFPYAAVTLAGIGSAIYHVAGGMATLQESNGKALHPGLFAAPGVMGLAIGGFLAFAGYWVGPWIALGLIGIGFVILMLPFPTVESNSIKKSNQQQHGLEMHDLVMIVLLLAIAMRSAVWNIFQVIHYGDYGLLLWIGLAAAIGKVSGGFLADKVGWQRYGVIALGLASILLTFGERSDLLLIIGVGVLQSATPVAIAAMYRFMPDNPGTAAGITLGLGIVLGGIPLFLGISMPETGWLIGGILVLIAFLYGWSLRKKNFQAQQEVKSK